jgi:hypothetical protein
VNFIPTYLMIKRHKVTGLMYFCKTIRSDPTKYRGSGKAWKKHLKEFGDDVETIWSQLFDKRDDIIEFASFFSEFYDIVSSTKNGEKIWANLIPEKGIGSFGSSGRRRPETEEEKLKRGKAISEAKKGKSNGRVGSHHSQETIDKIKKQAGWKHRAETKDKMRGIPKSLESRKKMSERKKGIPWTESRKNAQLNRKGK